jgi:DNA polymerase elongation subunit (family B)
MDTDSIFVHGTWEERETIHNLINDFVKRTYNIDNIKFGLESHWKVIGFPRSTKGEKAKKKYYGIVYRDKTGEVVDKFEEAGMETLRGDWTELAQMVQETLKKMQVEGVPKEKMLEFYETTKVNLYKGLYDPLLVLEKHMSKDVSEYGKEKMGKSGKMHKAGIPQHVKAFKNATETGWVPNDMVQYGVVQFVMTRGNIPKLINLVKPGEIDYQWYVTKQIDPIVWRLGIIEAVTKYHKTKELGSSQTTLG